MITPELIKYIKNSVASKEPKAVVYARLLPKGWTQKDLDEAYATVLSQSPQASTRQITSGKRSVGEYLTVYSPSIVRYAMSLVVLWFGVQQFIDTASWLAYVPDSAVALTHLSTQTLVYINGTIEVIFGTLLIFGWKTRWVALILALHLFDIMYIVGYGEIGVRDFGLATALFTIFMHGPDPLSLDAY